MNGRLALTGVTPPTMPSKPATMLSSRGRGHPQVARRSIPWDYEHWPLYGPAGLPSEHPDAQRAGEGADGNEGEPDRVPGREEDRGEDHRAVGHRVQNGPDGALV